MRIMHDGIIRDMAMVSILRGYPKNSTILDVGGTNRSYKDFVSENRYHILNIIPSSNEKDISFTLASATEIPFDSNTFDFVISSDTIEHIPIESRKEAIDEMIRVAKKEIVLFVPCGKYAKKYEKIILNIGLFFKRNMKWLIEHENCVLPMEEDINEILRNNNSVEEFKIFNNHNIFLWFLSSLFNPVVRFTFNRLDRVKMGEHLKFWGYFSLGKNHYRKIYVIRKK